MDTVDRLAEIKSQPARVRLVEQFLLERLTERAADPIAERALQLIYRNPETTIAKLAGHCGMGRRQLERRVSTYFGQSPVELRCLARFYHVARRLALDPSNDALETALDAGYFDQAHFIREFKRFTGMTPGAFRQRAATKTHFYNPRTDAMPRLDSSSRSQHDDIAVR